MAMLYLWKSFSNIANKKIGAKNFYSNFFYGKSRTEEILCKTKGSKLNVKICDYKILLVLLIAFLSRSGSFLVCGRFFAFADRVTFFSKKFVRIFRLAHIYGRKEKHKGDDADGQYRNAAFG